MIPCWEAVFLSLQVTRESKDILFVGTGSHLAGPWFFAQATKSLLHSKSMVYLQNILLTCLPNKGLHPHPSKHLHSEAAQKDKNGETTRIHIVALSSKCRFTYTHIHTHTYTYNIWNQRNDLEMPEGHFLELKEDQCLQVERTQKCQERTTMWMFLISQNCTLKND